MKWLKDVWKILWEYEDTPPGSLNQTDKRYLWYGSFMTCLTVLALSTLGDLAGTLIANHRIQQQTNEIINTVIAYMSTATNDEYDELTEQLRKDLIIIRHNNDIKELLQYIPNTADHCPTCMKDYPSQAYLIGSNTGMLFSLDLYEKGDTPEDGFTGVSTNFGYDEVSQTNVQVVRAYSDNLVTAKLTRGKGIVSLHRMKRLFCDNCINNILDATKNQLIDEFFLFDSETKAFHPVDSGTTVQIGKYVLEIEYEENTYEIKIR